MIEINHNPSRRQLHVFSLTWLLFFGVMAVLSWYRGGGGFAPLVLAAAAVGVPLAGLAAPSGMRWLYLGMSYLALPIGWAVSHILFALLYYVVITPIGRAMSASGYDPMGRRFHPKADTYWTPRESPAEVDRYFRQI